MSRHTHILEKITCADHKQNIIIYINILYASVNHCHTSKNAYIKNNSIIASVIFLLYNNTINNWMSILHFRQNTTFTLSILLCQKKTKNRRSQCRINHCVSLCNLFHFWMNELAKWIIQWFVVTYWCNLKKELLINPNFTLPIKFED